MTEDKRTAALAAVAEIESGMLVGLGTGSTAAYAVQAIGALVGDGLDVTTVATSIETERLAVACGIRVIDFADVTQVDLTIDGTDEIDPSLRAIKGAGGAMLREKIVADASRRMVVIADASKKVERLGQKMPVPVEVIPFARAFLSVRLERLGARPVLRMTGAAPYRTNGNNLVLDCQFPAIEDVEALARDISLLPGVLGHGLFLQEVDAAYIADAGVVTRLERGGVIR